MIALNCKLQVHSECFLGSCVCHPGYDGENCDVPLSPANKWYTRHCPNLLSANTANESLPLELVGGEYWVSGVAEESKCLPANPHFCSYLCFSHNSVGTARVPVSLWRAAQKAEGDLWAEVGSWNRGDSAANDRAREHWAAFDFLKCLPVGWDLGNAIEVGAGPWTQLKVNLTFYRQKYHGFW
jgi:hypothetical protein